MTTANIVLVLIVILVIKVYFLSKKSIEQCDANAIKITVLRSYLNNRCDDVVSDLITKEKTQKTILNCLRQETNDCVKKTEAVKEELAARIASLEDGTGIAISEAKRQAVDKAEAAYTRATQYSDEKVDGAKRYAEELRDELVRQLEERINALVSVLDSLNEENTLLREELTEQKKKLNFYANIDEIAENLTVKEDAEERARALEAVRRQILSQKQAPTTSEDDNRAEEEESKSESSRQEETPPLSFSVVSGYGNDALKHEEGKEETPTEGKILDNEQEFARNYIENTTENVFITGKAGAGKSFLLDTFRLTTSKANIVLAPTGIAALNVKGSTLHSMFGYYNLVKLNVDHINERTIHLKSEQRQVLRRVRTIIIDEISMVRADVFDKIDRILKTLNRSDLPFGGKQMLIFGDLFQLPPVTQREELNYLNDRYGGIFFFHSDAYKAGNFKFAELTHNHRQEGDNAFFAILNRIREGRATDADIEQLNSRYTSNEGVYDTFTTLFPKREEAERVNRERLGQIPNPEYAFKAKIILDKKTNKNKSIEKAFPISDVLRLRRDATVMMVANDPGGRWVNGTLGIVRELSQDRITVSFGREKVYEIYPIEFDEQDISYADGKITYEKVFSVMQYPIVLAYAITIHKSQGQTYGNIVCDIEKCFASGQAYVALSRCVSLKGLHLKSLITRESIMVNHEVLDFYREQSANDLLR